jgi:hypothetical protein
MAILCCFKYCLNTEAEKSTQTQIQSSFYDINFRDVFFLICLPTYFSMPEIDVFNFALKSLPLVNAWRDLQSKSNYSHAPHNDGPVTEGSYIGHIIMGLRNSYHLVPLYTL